MDTVRLQAAVEQMNASVLGGTTALQAAWSQVVSALELGPARAMRACPHCGRLGMLEATLCGYCWATLTVAP